MMKHWISARATVNIPPRAPSRTPRLNNIQILYRDILLLNHRHQGTVLLEMSNIYSCDIPPRVWGREARHQGGGKEKKRIYLQCFLKNTPKCVSILWFSQLQIHSNFFISFKLLKFGHEVNIISTNSFLSGSYLEQLKRKCISSSTSPELHCWQSLWCRGIPWYLPNYLQMMRGNSKFTYTPPELKVPYQFQIFFITEASFHFCICLQFPIRAVIHFLFPQI